MQFNTAFAVICLLAFACSICCQSFVAENNATHDDEPINTWEKFKAAFNKSYSSANEEAIRKANFEKNLAWIRENNGKNGQTYSINGLADMSDDETKSLLGHVNPKGPLASKGITVLKNLPISLNYKYLFNEIEFQNPCNSCWAFAAADTLQAAVTLKRRQKMPSLSKQELMDCISYGNTNTALGCSKGYDSYSALKYVQANGIAYTAEVPYLGRDDYCRRQTTRRAVPPKAITGVFQLPVEESQEEVQLMSALAHYGPLAVSIYADIAFMNHKQDYRAVSDYQHSTRTPNHVVILTGYGRHPRSGEPVWIIRNSWGKTWGDKGYGYILRGRNIRNINSFVVVVTIY